MLSIFSIRLHTRRDYEEWGVERLMDCKFLMFSMSARVVNGEIGGNRFPVCSRFSRYATRDQTASVCHQNPRSWSPFSRQSNLSMNIRSTYFLRTSDGNGFPGLSSRNSLGALVYWKKKYPRIPKDSGANVDRSLYFSLIGEKKMFKLKKKNRASRWQCLTPRLRASLSLFTLIDATEKKWKTRTGAWTHRKFNYILS